MRAAVMEGVREPLVVRDMPDPECAPHGAIVRVEANGVCRSDWHGWVGDWGWIGVEFEFPHVLGHEFCGVVEEVGAEVKRFKAGDRVIVPFSQGEGSCELCLTGHSNICQQGFAPGFSYWGGFGSMTALPHADTNLVLMPETMSFVDGAGLGCRYMTSFHGIVDQAQVRPGEWVAVHGCGGIGLSVIQIATALGANVIGIDIDPAKLTFAKRLGAVETVLAGNTDPAEAVHEITKGGAHVSVDGLGIKATCQNSIASLRPRGRHLQIGQTGAEEQGEIAVPIDVILGRELVLVGSSGMPAMGYGAMLNMIAAGRLAPGKLVTQTLSLEEAGAVLASMDNFSTIGIPVIDRY
ncbi:MAG: zinc-dependent alcohol dehydrogenase family protein [Pseudomonadota bacterium]|nr:zinc-dependent alcohol dehydrogenase family protein [Pseudomonadota bacterium]